MASSECRKTKWTRFVSFPSSCGFSVYGLTKKCRPIFSTNGDGGLKLFSNNTRYQFSRALTISSKSDWFFALFALWEWGALCDWLEFTQHFPKIPGEEEIMRSFFGIPSTTVLRLACISASGFQVLAVSKRQYSQGGKKVWCWRCKRFNLQ